MRSLTVHRRSSAVLMLAAVYCSSHPHLSQMIQECSIQNYLDEGIRTLDWYHRLSPVLERDLSFMRQARDTVDAKRRTPGLATTGMADNVHSGDCDLCGRTVEIDRAVPSHRLRLLGPTT